MPTAALEKPEITKAAAAQKQLLALPLALVIFACANLILLNYSRWYQPDIKSVVLAPGADRNNHAKTWSWWIAHQWLKQDKAPDIVLFGSSQIGSALCAADAQHRIQVIDSLMHRHAVTMEDNLANLTGQPISIFSLASPGAMCSDAFMASKTLFDNRLTPKIVILTVSPRDFIDNTMPYPAVTEPFKFYQRFTSPGALTTSAYLEPMSWLQFAVDSLPFRKLGSHVQSNFFLADPETKTAQSTATNNALAAVLGGSEAQPGKWLVPANIPPLWVDNSKEYIRRFKQAHPPVYKAEQVFFDQFLRTMHNRGIKVLVVGMPSLPMNRHLLPDSFWTEFRNQLSQTADQRNAQWLDLTGDSSFQKADYLDTVHLNASGGAKLFSKLSAYVAENEELSTTLKSPQRK